MDWGRDMEFVRQLQEWAAESRDDMRSAVGATDWLFDAGCWMLRRALVAAAAVVVRWAR